MARRRRDDDDDDRPIRRRTKRRPQASALPWVLAAVGCIVLFCGGFATLVYLTAIHPKLDVARRAARDNREYEANAKVSKTKLSQLRAGMTLPQVETVLGPGRAANNSDVFTAAARFPNDQDIQTRWESASKQGRVYLWEEFTDRILIAFSVDPKAGGTAVGILGSIDTSRTYSETVRLPGGTGGH